MPLSASPSKLQQASAKPEEFAEKIAAGSAPPSEKLASKEESGAAEGGAFGEEAAELADLALKAVGDKVEEITHSAADLLKSGASTVRAACATAAATLLDVVHKKEGGESQAPGDGTLKPEKPAAAAEKGHEGGEHKPEKSAGEKSQEDGKQKPEKSAGEKSGERIDQQGKEGEAAAPEDGKPKPESPEKVKDAVDGGVLSVAAPPAAAADQGQKDQPAVDQGQKDQPAADQGHKDQPAADQGHKDQPAADQGHKDQPAADRAPETIAAPQAGQKEDPAVQKTAEQGKEEGKELPKKPSVEAGRSAGDEPKGEQPAEKEADKPAKKEQKDKETEDKPEGQEDKPKDTEQKAGGKDENPQADKPSQEIPGEAASSEKPREIASAEKPKDIPDKKA